MDPSGPGCGARRLYPSLRIGSGAPRIPPHYAYHPVAWSAFHASSGNLAYAQIGGRLEKPIRFVLIDRDPADRAVIIASLRVEFPEAEIADIADAESLRAALARERRRAVASDFRLEDLLARLNVGVCRARLDGAILYANPSFRRILGTPPSPAPLPPLYALLPHAGAAGTGGADALRGGKPRVTETRVEARDGETRWISITESLAALPRHLDDSFAEDNGEPAEAVIELLVEDITERKLLDMRLREQEEAMRRMRNLETVGRLAGGVAHDFNNMLTAINGYSELLLAMVEDGNPLRSTLGEIHRAGARLAGLTRDLLAFSGRQMLQSRRMDLNRLLLTIAPEAARTLGEAIRLEMELHPDPQPVDCDGDQFKLALMNLIANARDAMPAGGLLRMATDTRRMEIPPGAPGGAARDGLRPGTGLGPGDFVVLTLADTGIGMDAAMQARVFEPFFTTKPMASRSGMGLSAAYGIIRQSGGEITVESEPGRGTRFRIWLPRADVPHVRRAAQAGPEGMALA